MFFYFSDIILAGCFRPFQFWPFARTTFLLTLLPSFKEQKKSKTSRACSCNKLRTISISKIKKTSLGIFLRHNFFLHIQTRRHSSRNHCDGDITCLCILKKAKLFEEKLNQLECSLRHNYHIFVLNTCTNKFFEAD